MELELGKEAVRLLVSSLEGHPNPRREIAACLDECNRLLNAIDHSEKDALAAFTAAQEQQVKELKAHHVAKCLGHVRPAIELDAGPSDRVVALPLKSGISSTLATEAAAMTKELVAPKPEAKPAVTPQMMAALAALATALAVIAFLVLK